jgi:putative phage-type endonuclease
MNEIQGSDEWFAARLGKVSASRLADVLATVKTGEAVTRRNYRMQLVCERLTGRKAETYTNAHMERGNALEPLARASYELRKGVMVDEVGFVQHPTIEMAGASPDGLVDGGSIEIKCPTPANHIETVLRGTAPSQYFAQMQWQMACLGDAYKFVDFVSYCPDVGEDLELFIVRVSRDDEWLQQAEKDVITFLNEVSETYSQLKSLKWL